MNAQRGILLQLDNFSYQYPGTEKQALKSVTMTLRAGECHCLTGPTSAGKSTLLLAVKGLLAGGEFAGSLRSGSDEKRPFHDVGIVLQNPETQLFRNTIGSEVAFGLENQCMAPKDMPAAVSFALSAVGLAKSLDTPVSALSMGEKYRLLLAALIAMDARLLLIDEPGAQLDAPGIAALKRTIRSLTATGKTVLITEHHPEFFADVVDTFWGIDISGNVGRIDPPETEPAETKLSCRPCSGDEIVQVQGLSAAADAAPPIWSEVSFSVREGDRAALTGANGAGKTTLLGCLTGFVKPIAGKVLVFGHPPSPERLRGSTGYLSQSPPGQLFETTVFEESAFPLKRLGTSAAERARRIEECLGRLGIAALAHRSPHKLSFGEQHLVALASVLVMAPRLLILDDPFAGLDDDRCGAIRDVLAEQCNTSGMAVVWATHHAAHITGWSNMMLSIEKGKIDVSTPPYC